VVVTDGRATSAGLSTTGALKIGPTQAALAAAAEIAAAGIEALVVDAEDTDLRLGLARDLAEAMGAQYTALPDLEAESLARAVLRVASPD
jgi:magnesium chelatase subunit D